jgi:hypothetical protein
MPEGWTCGVDRKREKKKRTLKRRGIKDLRVDAILNCPLAQAVTLLRMKKQQQ